MANLCEKLITDCIVGSCDNPVYTGIDSIGWIFNRSEIDLTATEASGNKDASNANIYKSIVMKTYTDDNETLSYTGFAVQQLGKTPFTGTQVEMTEGTSSNKFTNTISFVVPDNSPAASLVLDSLANGKFVFVLNNDYVGSDGRGKFQIFGLKKGCTASAIVCEKYSEDTEGGWQVTLTEENVPQSALFLEHKTTDTVDTETYLGTITSDCE